MGPAEALANTALVLEPELRKSYFNQGYLYLPELIDDESLGLLQASMAKAVALSRDLTESNQQFILGEGHSSSHPKLKQVAFIDDIDVDCWEFCRDSIITDIAEDILGPDLRFGDVSIDFKWAEGEVGVEWHQDIAFYPHANVGTCQFMVAMTDVNREQGPLQIISGSHKNKVYAHYPNIGNWTGAIEESELRSAGVGDVAELCGPAGSVSLHHSCTIHRSAPTNGFKGRPVFMITYCAADAIPYTTGPYLSSHYGEMVRGRLASPAPQLEPDLNLFTN